MGVERPYQATTMTPRIPVMQLNTRATMPRGVKLSRLVRTRREKGEGGEGSGFSPARDCAGRLVLAGEVQEVGSVACSVALCEGVGSSANGEVVVGNGQVLLDVERGFDKGGEKTRGNMPLKMAVEKPNA
jgi:hypothetical protein